MKISMIFFSILCMSFTLTTEHPLERLEVPGPLKFNKENFILAWTDRPNEHYIIQEYLPLGEKLEHFNQMMTLHVFDSNIRTKDAVQEKINELMLRKKTDAVCNYKVTESPDGKEFMVDFLLGESKGEEMTLVEFNIYRYKQVSIGKNKKGILVYAFSKRSYGDDITTFFKTLKVERTDFLNQMIGVELPGVNIDGN